MTYTTDQQTVLNSANEFFLSATADTFLLTGYAGTGKTTLVRALIEELLDGVGDEKQPYNVVLMAPTGRAAVVLAKKTGHAAATIHRTIYKIEDGPQEFDGKLRFMLRENNDSPRTVYFVDEASMVSDIPSDNELLKFGSGCLLHDLLQYCGHRKVVFVGDPAQLPPVNQNNSPALDEDCLTTKYQREVMSVCMREVVRQSNNSGIYANAAIARNAIECDDFNQFGIMTSDDVRIARSLFDEYATAINGSANKNTIIITYSNARALDYNTRVRRNIFGPHAERLVAGDLLIISRNNYAYSTELFNGTIVEVAACAIDDEVERRTVHYYSRKKDDNKKSIIKEMKLSFRSVTLEMDDGTLVKCQILDSFLTDEDGTPHPELSQALYVDFTNRHPNLKRKSTEYYDALKHDPYFNAVICKYGYAITGHKSQGGEWQNVYIDMGRTQSYQTSDFFRWAYTAITRSNHLLYVASAPHFNQFSEMQVSAINKGGNIVFYTPQGLDFMDYRYKKICTLCTNEGLDCHENRNNAYQHVLFITDNHGGSCTAQLYYGKNGYTGHDIITHSSSPELKECVSNIIFRSLIPDEMPFIDGNERLSKLYRHIDILATEVGLTILNIVCLQYVDRFFLTNGADMEIISFQYNGKERYTNCTLQSTAGLNDKELSRFREELTKQIN